MRVSYSDEKLKKELLEVGNSLLYCNEGFFHRYRPQKGASVDNLLRRLCQIRSCLCRVEQAPTEYIKNALSPSLKALIADKLIEHSNVDVKVALASCLSEIIRITAPDAPYDDPQMKEVLRLIVSSFGNLHDKSSPWYAERILILDSVAKARLGVVMLDLECDALILEMFQKFFKTIREHHQENVFSSMKTIMVHVIEESDNISLDLLSPILDSLNKKNEVVLPIARKLGESVLESCATKVEPHLRQAVNKLGISLDDYSDGLASICIVIPEASETVRSSKKRNSSSKGSGSSKKKTQTCSGSEIKGASKSSSGSDSPKIKKRKPSKVGLTAAKKVSAQQLPIISEETGDKEAGLTAAKDQSLPLIKRMRTSKTTSSKVPPSSSTRAASEVSAAVATEAPLISPQAEGNSVTLPNVILSKISQFQPSTPPAQTISTQSPPSSQRITNDKPELEDPSTPSPPPNFQTLVQNSDPSITIATASELPPPQITTIGSDRIAIITEPEPDITTTIDLTNSESSPNISLNLSPPSTYPEIEDFSKIIFGQVKELLDERSRITNPMESDLKWDNIRKQVDEFLVSLKESSRQQALANQEALKEWLAALLTHVDLMDLRTNPRRYLPAPKRVIDDDIPETDELATPVILERSVPLVGQASASASISSMIPSMDVVSASEFKEFKEEIKGEMASQKRTQVAMKNQLDTIQQLLMTLASKQT
ncbi:nucleolar protein dao-5 [Trifolium repens]|nr:nucleolar protein dao-5 [Trifolium repens]